MLPARPRTVQRKFEQSRGGLPEVHDTQWRLGARLLRSVDRSGSGPTVTRVTATSSPLPILPTSLVGSYAQPDWLIDRARLADRFPRVRAKELWRVDPEYLEQAHDDATMLAVPSAPRRKRIDIITDGEMRRESYSNHFATALEGVDIDNPGTALDRSGHPDPGAADRRTDRAAAPRRRPRPEVPEGAHRPHREDDRARPVHDVSAGAERPLPRPRVSGAGVRRRGRRRWKNCMPPAPTWSSSTSRTCRQGRTRRASIVSPRSTPRSMA